jgi:hypothetical protein
MEADAEVTVVAALLDAEGNLVAAHEGGLDFAMSPGK